MKSWNPWFWFNNTINSFRTLIYYIYILRSLDICVYMYICAYICVYICTYICIYVCIYVHIYMHIYTHVTHTYIWIYKCTYVCTHICTSTCPYIRTFICRFMSIQICTFFLCISIHMYINAHIHMWTYTCTYTYIFMYTIAHFTVKRNGNEKEEWYIRDCLCCNLKDFYSCFLLLSWEKPSANTHHTDHHCRRCCFVVFNHRKMLTVNWAKTCRIWNH